MPTPTCLRDLLCAAQQSLRDIGSSIGTLVSIGSRGRAAIVVLGVVLLCGASTVREFEIGIRERRVEGNVATLRVKRGETVQLRFRTDEAVSLHLHGYDVQLKLSPVSPEAMRFDAKVAGRFPITAHEFGAAADRDAQPKDHREMALLYLEVLPE